MNFLKLNAEPFQIKELENYNLSIEKTLLSVQKTYNDTKIKLEDIKESLEFKEKTIVSANKKIEAVKKEIEKLKKMRMSSNQTKNSNLASVFSSPPPNIQNSKILQTNSSTKSGIFKFFSRG